MDDFNSLGWNVYHGIIADSLIQGALRLINRDIFRRGLLPDEVAHYYTDSAWFPWLREEPEIIAIERALPSLLRTGELTEPQILLHLPDAVNDHWPLVTHVDKEPAWAGDRKYKRIVGVALTRSHIEDGGLMVEPLDGSGGLRAVELDPGDVICFNPLLPHTSGMNRRGTIRYALYFRYLE